MRRVRILATGGTIAGEAAVATDARDAQGRGVILVINDDLHSAREVTKSNTTDVHAFTAPGAGLLGTARY